MGIAIICVWIFGAIGIWFWCAKIKTYVSEKEQGTIKGKRNKRQWL